MKRAHIAIVVTLVGCGVLTLFAAPKGTTKADPKESATQEAVRMLMREYKAKIDGTRVPADWPKKIRQPDKWTWVVDIDTSKLPGGYPEQIVVTVGSAGGHSGSAKQREESSNKPDAPDKQ